MDQEHKIDIRDECQPVILHSEVEETAMAAIVTSNPCSLILRCHPVASKIVNAAIDEAIGRSALMFTRDEVEQHLTLTLTTAVRTFFDLEDRKGALDELAHTTRPWIMDQMSSCVTATVLAQLARFHEDIDSEFIFEKERRQLTHLIEISRQFNDNPRYRAQQRSIDVQIQRINDSILDRSTNNQQQRASVLSNILGMCDSNGCLKPMALAALITHGNRSAGRELTNNPVQLLTPSESAMLFGVKKSKLISQVSEVRKKAEAAPVRIRRGRHIVKPGDLWIVSTTSSSES